MTNATSRARKAVRAIMPVEGDLCFRRRCETILELLDPKPGETVLDCGCGYGFTLRVLGELTGADLIGLDLGADRLSETQLELGDRVRLVRASAEELPFDSNSIDKAVSSEVFEHLPDDQAAAKELFRVLKPGGTLVITVPSDRYPAGWDPVNWALQRTSKHKIAGERTFSGIWYGHLRLYSMDGLADLLTSAGFEIEEKRPLTHFVPPFSHLIMYGILKPLLMSGKLPRSLASAGDRSLKSRRLKPPVSWAAAVLNAIDRKNDDPTLPKRVDTFVALAVKARKPAAPLS